MNPAHSNPSYYVWDVKPTKPIILIHNSQVQDFLEEINNHIKLNLQVTDQQRKDGFVACFPNHPRCLPRYLGRSNSREEFHIMADNVPSDKYHAVGEPSHPPLEGRSLEDFKQLMEKLWDVQKANNKASKAKKQQERLTKQRSMSDQFKRAQRYLGLRPSAVHNTMQSSPLEAIDPTISVPFFFEQSVVFVCVDVESYERAHHKITEIGVATLDTNDLIGVAPGMDGTSWREKIRARHFRINEYRHLVNSAFVTGCPDRFDFGESTPTALKDAAQYVAACFHPPFGALDTNDDDGVASLITKVDQKEKRNIVFLGHDTLGDVRYLQQLGYDPLKVENILEALDTAVLYRVWRREHTPRNLGKILMDFDIAGFNLHNAGNDAVFTVQAMLAICVREATIRGSAELESIREQEKAARLASAVDDAKQRAMDEAEGWSDTEVDGDGGPPVPLAMNDAPKPIPAQYGDIFSSDGGGNGKERGRGRGRGDSSRGKPIPQDNYRGGSERGEYRSSGRGRLLVRGRSNRRGRGAGYDRGRGRGSVDSAPRDAPSDTQVRLSVLIICHFRWPSCPYAK